MKPRTLLTVFLLSIMVAGCAGTQFRDQILLPMAAEIYGRLYPQIELGLEDAVTDGELTQEGADFLLSEADKLREILLSGDRSRIAEVDWTALETWATRGVQRLVDDGTISPIVATSLYQRIVNFRDLLLELGIKLCLTWPTRTASKSFYIGRYYLGELPVADFTRTPLERHNRPRRALGVKEVTAEEVGL